MELSFNEFKVIFEAAIAVVGIVLTRYIVPFIKSKISAENLNQFDIWVDRTIKACDKLFTPEQWKEKKEYAMSQLTNALNNGTIKVKVTQAELEIFLEGKMDEAKGKLIQAQ